MPKGEFDMSYIDPRLEPVPSNEFPVVAEEGLQSLMDAREAANNSDEEEQQEQE